MHLRPSLTLRSGSSRRTAFTLIELLTVISIIGILAAILIPVVGSAINSAKKQKTYAELNNILSMCKLYKQEYKYYPVLPPATTSTSQATVMQLKQTPSFVPVMTGNLSTNAAYQKYNTRAVPFATFSDDELNTQGTEVLDPYGNDGIVIIMDTPGLGNIPANIIKGITLIAGNSQTGYESHDLTIPQTVPVHSDILVASPGRGLTDNDVVTTWDVQ